MQPMHGIVAQSVPLKLIKIFTERLQNLNVSENISTLSVIRYRMPIQEQDQAATFPLQPKRKTDTPAFARH